MIAKTTNELLLILMTQGLMLIRRSSNVNPQYAYEIADAIHNFPDWVMGRGLFIEEYIIRAAIVIFHSDRAAITEKWIGREGLGRYNNEIARSSLTKNGNEIVSVNFAINN